MVKSITVLLVEDQPGDARLIQEILLQEAAASDGRSRYAITHVERVKDALAALSNAPFDIVLLDLSLPDSKGLATVERMLAAAVDLPVVVVSGLEDQELSLAAVQSGAQDYLVKSYVNQFSLPRTLHYAIERHEAQKTIREREGLFRSVLNSLGEHMAVLEKDGRIVAVNEAWRQFARANGDPDLRHTDVGVNYLDVVRRAAEQDAPEAGIVAEGIQDVIDGRRRNFILDYPCHSDDTERWFTLTVWPLATKEGGVVISHINITQRVEAEAERVRLAATVEQSGDAVVISRPNGDIVYANSAYKALSQPHNGRPGRRTLAAVVGESDEAAFLSSLHAKLAAGQSCDWATERKLPDGSHQYLETTISPIKDRVGEMTHYVAVTRDVTERARHEREREAVLAVAAALRTATTREEILSLVLDQVRDLLRAGGAAFLVYDPATQSSVVEMANGAWAGGIGLRLSGAEGDPAGLFNNGGSFVTADVRQASNGCRVELSGPFAAVAGFPLQAQDEILGALWVGRETAVSDIERHLLVAIADIVVNALQRVEFYEEMRRQMERLTTVSRLGHALGHSLNLPDIYRQLTATVRQLMPDLASLIISRYDEDTELISCRYGYDIADEVEIDISSLPPVPLEPEGWGFQSEVIRTQRPLIANDYAGRLKRTHSVIATNSSAEQIASVLLVPLLAEGRVLGVLYIQSYEPDYFSQNDAELLTLVANTTAVAIINAELFGRTNRLLRQTQDQAREIRQIMDTVPEGLLLLDANGLIRLTNPFSDRYLDRLGGGAIGDRLTHLGNRSMSDLLAVAPDGAPWHEIRSLDRNSTFEVTARAMQNEAQEGGWLLVLRDVTEERQQHEIIQSQERLATVGQLAAGIAHDFNNILAVIIMYAQMLRNDPGLTDKARRRLRTMEEQAERAAVLIRQILDFSRRSVMEMTVVSLTPFLKELMGLLKRTVPENIHIELCYDDGDHLVRIDPTRLQQVIMNLVVNARDAMKEGGSLKLALSSFSLADDQRPPLPGMTPGSWIRLFVFDTGDGIESENLPHIFEPFFTTKGPNEGTGLGLAQVYGIVKQHEGHIDVASQLGEGTTFTIYLPALVVPEQEQASGSDERPFVSGGKETVLVVEDNASARQALCEVLDGLGYKVLVAEDGREALAIYDAHADAIELVVSDLVMPAMGGDALYRALKSRDASVRMMVTTGYPLEAAGKTLLERGAVAWVQKPFSMDKIADAVRQALDTEPVMAPEIG